MTILARPLIVGLAWLCLVTPSLAQSFPGNPNSGQVWLGQGPNAQPNWSTIAGDCNMSASGAINCPTLGGVAPGALFSLGVGTGLSSSGGKLNVSGVSFSSISGQATFAQFPTMNADNIIGNFTGGSTTPGQGALTSCSAASSALTYNTGTHAFGCNSISGSGTPGYGITIVANVVSAPLMALVVRQNFGGL